MRLGVCKNRNKLKIRNLGIKINFLTINLLQSYFKKKNKFKYEKSNFVHIFIL